MSEQTKWGMKIPTSYVVLDAAGGVYWRDEETNQVCYAPMHSNGTVAWDDGGELDSRVDEELERAAKLAVDLLDVLISSHKAWMDEYSQKYGPQGPVPPIDDFCTFCENGGHTVEACPEKK